MSSSRAKELIVSKSRSQFYVAHTGPICYVSITFKLTFLESSTQFQRLTTHNEYSNSISCVPR